MSQLGNLRTYVAVEDMAIEPEVTRGIAKAHQARLKLGAAMGCFCYCVSDVRNRVRAVIKSAKARQPVEYRPEENETGIAPFSKPPRLPCGSGRSPHGSSDVQRAEFTRHLGAISPAFGCVRFCPIGRIRRQRGKKRLPVSIYGFLTHIPSMIPKVFQL